MKQKVKCFLSLTDSPTLLRKVLAVRSSGRHLSVGLFQLTCSWRIEHWLSRPMSHPA